MDEPTRGQERKGSRIVSSGARQRILSRVRQALAPLENRAAYPEYADRSVVTLPDGVDLWTHFTEQFGRVHGRSMTDVNELSRYLLEHGWARGYCDPTLQASVGDKLGAGFQLEYTFQRDRADDYQFGITRAVGIIAESGSIVVNDATTSSRLGSLAPWVHIAVVRPGDIWDTIPTALQRFGDDPNTIWITGPSKTADIEGILIEGVHGPGEQICLRLDY